MFNLKERKLPEPFFRTHTTTASAVVSTTVPATAQAVSNESAARIQYGRGEYVSFSVYAVSNIAPAEKLFTRKFVLTVYASLFEVAIICGSNNPFSYRPEVCLWIKQKLETLSVAEQDKIQEFVVYLKKLSAMIEKYDAPTEHQVNFLMTLKHLFGAVRNYVSKRCPVVANKVLDDVVEKSAAVLPELPIDLPKLELIGRVAREDFVVSDIKEGSNLFSAAFAESCYKKLIDMSQQCGSSRMLYRYDACIEVKDMMEKARIDWESYRAVIVKIPNEIKQATGVNGTEHFLAALSEILKDVVDYVATVRPELEKSRLDCLKKLGDESAALKSDMLETV